MQKCPTASFKVKTFNIFAGGQVSGTQNLTALEKQIVDIKKIALGKWYQGDPSAYIGIMGNDIGYFEPSLEKDWIVVSR
jgi:hypothetical protein